MVNTIAMLAHARQTGVYVPAFNIYNLETMQAALEASKRAAQPVILAFGERYLQNASLEVIAAMAQCLTREHPYETALHLDHCCSLECIQKALEAGFTSVMYDGSDLPLEKNIEGTLKARKLADAFGASLEGELGGLNDEFGGGSVSAFTDPAQAEIYVRETGVNSLAVSVGNAHGLYKGVPHIDQERLQAIYERVQIPLVLHGSSGIPMKTLRESARIAVAKINVNTEITMAGADALRRSLETEKRMEKPVLAARESMTETMVRFYC